MTQPFIGAIQPFGFQFAPIDWAFCNGQLLPIGQNEALFSLIGTTYGGDGVNTFALPDTQGRSLIHQGTDPGMSTYFMGEASGAETVTMAASQMPAHTHLLLATSTNANAAGPTDSAFLAAATGEDEATLAPVKVQIYGPPDAMIGIDPTSQAGGSQPLGILQPFLTVNFCIALFGIFPTRA